MAKRRMISTANGPQGVFLSGQVYDFGLLGCEGFGQALEEAGYAERVFEAAVEERGERAIEPPAAPPEAVEEPESEPLEPWTLKRFGPESYLASHPDGPNAELAQKYVDAGRPHG